MTPVALGAAAKMKSRAAKFGGNQVAPEIPGMRSLKEEQEVAQLLQKISADRETLQMFAEQGKQGSRPYENLEEQCRKDTQRAATLQSKAPHDAAAVAALRAQLEEQRQEQRRLDLEAEAQAHIDQQDAQGAAEMGEAPRLPQWEPEPEPPHQQPPAGGLERRETGGGAAGGAERSALLGELDGLSGQ